MKLKSVKGVLLVGVMILSLLTNVCAAPMFPDVTEDSYGWAQQAVEEMAENGIVKGYEDDTFRPEKTVTKLEALVLISRILGVDEEVNEGIMEVAYEKYGDTVGAYELPYGEDEVIYLLAKNVISVSELSGYISGSNASAGLKRYEVAVLMTKAMGAEEQVKQNLVTVLDYEDEDKIPSYAKKYVEYVSQEEIMMGVDETHFSPDTDVNRAQIAVLLKRVIDASEIEQYKAAVASVDPIVQIVRLRTSEGETYGYSIKDDTQIRFDGEKCILDEVKVGDEAVVTTRNGKLFSIDFLTPDVEEVVKGSIVSVSRTASTQSIKLNEFKADGTEETNIYTCAEDVVIDSAVGSSTFTDLKAGDYAELTLKKGKIISVYAEEKTMIARGVVTDITLDGGVVTIEIKNADDEEEKYVVSNDEVKVTKNSKAAEFTDVVVGDSVSLTLTYREVTKIVATSQTKSANGVVEEIIISANPSVTLKLDGESKTYPLAKDVEIKINGVEGTIYDLRLATAASVTLESETITKISTSPVETIGQVTGTVDFVNVSYGLIQVTYFDTATAQNVTRSVFVGKTSKIFDNATSKDIPLKNLTAGSVITAVGTSASGIFEANTIIVISTK
ncbi:MAG: S-layer homology domain-containing protein [Ruminococcaceae bacterium]|nr:S-layer homology domain-containing protein [Oscillospiraceae bacterium]